MTVVGVKEMNGQSKLKLQDSGVTVVLECWLVSRQITPAWHNSTGEVYWERMGKEKRVMM